MKAISLLLGCGSILPTIDCSGDEVGSLAMDLLIAGSYVLLLILTAHLHCGFFAVISPSVFGLLWHVTDLDLDRFTLKWLSRWLDLWSAEPLSSLYNVRPSSELNPWGALISAKRYAKPACLLQLVTGAACICVGLPF